MGTMRLAIFLALLAQAHAGSPSPPAGTGAQAWACGGAGSGAQAWALQPSALPPLAYLALKSNDHVLSVPGASNETSVQLGVEARAPAPARAQLWALGSDGLLRSALNSRCAGVADPVLGAHVTLLPCNASDGRQLWGWGGNASLVQAARPGSSGGCLDIGGALTCASPALASMLHCNTSAPAEARAAALAAQLGLPDLRLLLGGWYASAGVPRLGLPRFSFAEALHGLGAGCGAAFSNASYTTSGCATSFPHATLLAAAFDRSLWAAVASAISTEARGNRGGLLLWTPDINLSRSQLWGRAQEVPGECPLLTSEYAAAFVTGLQAEAPGLPLRASATCKHYHSYDFEGGSARDGNVTRHTFNALISTKDLTEYYTVPFKACVQAGAGSVMSSINAVNGIPGAAATNYTVRLLRQQWGAKGFVTSDCGTVADLQRTHHYSATAPQAVADAVHGGTDYNCGNAAPPPGLTGEGYFNAFMPAAVAAGLVEVGELQGAAARLLTTVVRLGLLDGDGSGGAYASWGREQLDTPAHRALALRGALQGIVLLRNTGGVLPLALPRLRTLALLGPHANMSTAMLANYAGSNSLVGAHTPLLRLGARAQAAGVAVAFQPGLPTPHSNDTSGIAAAAGAAGAADAAVLFVGLDQTMEREGLDRESLALPPAQAALLAAVSQACGAASVPLVVVLVGGGAIAEPALGAGAVVASFYPGELGGEALAMLLLGEAAFSGRLPVTFYTPSYDARRPAMDMQLAPHGAVPGATYWHASPGEDVLHPFGAGLCAAGGFVLSWGAGGGGGNATVDAGAWASGAAPAPAWRVQVTRAPTPPSAAAAAAADVSVLGFVAPAVPLAGEARLKLFDFARASGAPGALPSGLAPGQGVEVLLTLPAQVAGRVDASGTRSLVPGVYSVRLGGDANGADGCTGQPLLAWLEVTGQPTVLDSLPF